MRDTSESAEFQERDEMVHIRQFGMKNTTTRLYLFLESLWFECSIAFPCKHLHILIIKMCQMQIDSYER